MPMDGRICTGQSICKIDHNLIAETYLELHMRYYHLLPGTMRLYSKRLGCRIVESHYSAFYSSQLLTRQFQRNAKHIYLILKIITFILGPGIRRFTVIILRSTPFTGIQFSLKQSSIFPRAQSPQALSFAK